MEEITRGKQGEGEDKTGSSVRGSEESQRLKRMIRNPKRHKLNELQRLIKITDLKKIHPHGMRTTGQMSQPGTKESIIYISY